MVGGGEGEGPVARRLTFNSGGRRRRRPKHGRNAVALRVGDLAG